MDNSDQTRSTMFLTEEEVRELTGISRGSRGRNGHELQAEQLKKMGIPFWVNAIGLPKIVREYFVGGVKAVPKPAKKWEPNPPR